MRKISNFIVDKRNIILIIFVIFSVLGLFISKNVNINSDIKEYLPKESETKIGYNIMNNNFEELKSSNLNIVFKNLTKKEKEETLNKLSKIKGVSSVDYDNSKDYNKGKYTLYTINVDDYDHSNTSKNIYEEVKENYNVYAMSGSIYDNFKPVIQTWIVGLSILLALIILIILSESYIEPFLYLITIGLAIFVNKGTNIIFPSVSNITDAITAILQLALSMDYSIMLSNRYKQEKENEKDNIKAMKNALYDSFKSISSSSVTTVVGLLALIFMTFTIGRDLGLVLAKGVLLSLVSIFLCLPSLLLLFEKLIQKFKKKALNINLEKLGNYSYKTRYIQLIIFVLAFISFMFLKGNLGILYTGSEQDEVAKIFKQTNQIAIIYENKNEKDIASYCKSIEKNIKANQVLCYGNTINEKLEYNKLNNKFNELGKEVNVDDYLLKIIYYNYFNKTNNSITLDDFINFIKQDIYNNNNLNKHITSNEKEKINLLENFSNNSNINKQRTSTEIANIFSLNEQDINDLFILYNSNNIDISLTINDFINFILNDVSNSSYNTYLNQETITNLKQLSNFTEIDKINKPLNKEELSNIFGIPEDKIEQLLIFYRTTIDTDTTLTVNEFTNFSLQLKDNNNYSNMFDNDTISKLELLNKISNEEFINTKYTTSELENILKELNINDIDENTLKALYIYNFINDITNNKTYTISEFTNNYLINNNNLNIDNNLLLFTNNEFLNKEISKEEIINILSKYGDYTDIINEIYNEYNNLTPLEIINIIKDKYNNETINKIIDLINISIKDNEEIKYNISEIINILENIYNINKDKILETYYKYNKMSIKEIINLVENNKDNYLISNKIKDKEQLIDLAYLIVNNTDKKYNYIELSNLINQDTNTIKNIYSLYDYNTKETNISEKQLVELLLNNKDNNLIKDSLNEELLNKLNILDKTIDYTLNNKKLNSTELSNLLSTDKELINLILSLYESKYIKCNNTKSLLEFTNFILNNVVNNPKYSSRITNDSKDKLEVVNTIMNNTIKNKTYTSNTLYNTLFKLTDNLDYNLIDLVYIYNGSINNYNNKWTLTIEELVNYLNDVIIKDNKFNKYIDTDMNKKIKESKTTVMDAKKLLVTDKYSRALINSKYNKEDKETFNFIKKTLDKIGKKKGVYVIGDSPMALEISKTFNDELNMITILTMIFIFIVVAFTFKDLLISIILVLTIQCSVFATMTILSFAGNSVFFIAILIVQAILMGATIDYAIVYTSYYLESRKELDVKESIINAYNKSIHTILTSSSILIIVTLIVSLFAEAIPAKICETISEGTIVSVILIIFVLPGVLSAFDNIIVNRKIKEKSN